MNGKLWQSRGVTTLYTIGHSNHPIESFIALLTSNGITAIADVRSRPYSRRHPQFNKDRLAASRATFLRLDPPVPLPTWRSRCLPDTMPLVTENEYVPRGLPIAITSWPMISGNTRPRRHFSNPEFNACSPAPRNIVWL